MNQILEFFLDWRAILQVAILFALIYAVLYRLRDSQGAQMLTGLLMLIAAMAVFAKVLDMDVISQLFELVLGSLFLMLMIIFQPELRRGLATMGRWELGKKRRRMELINEVINAMVNMSKRKCGAIVVIEGKDKLQPLIDDAISLDANVDSLLLESIFFPNSPLHDGAVIISGDRIVAARAILPLSAAANISNRMGTRHRAALGMSEESDAVTVLVSEESGAITIGYNGKLFRDLSLPEMNKILDELIVQKDAGELEETITQLNDAELSGDKFMVKEEENE